MGVSVLTNNRIDRNNSIGVQQESNPQSQTAYGFGC